MRKKAAGKIYGIAGYMKNGSISGKEMDFTSTQNFLRVNDALEALILDGAEELVVSMDDGPGLLAASVVLLLQKKYPHVRLSCLMLWEEQAAYWPESLRTLWFHVFEKCQQEIVLEHHRSEENLQKRDSYLTEHCQGLLVFSGEHGGEAAWPLLARGRLAGLDVREERLAD